MNKTERLSHIIDFTSSSMATKLPPESKAKAGGNNTSSHSTFKYNKLFDKDRQFIQYLKKKMDIEENWQDINIRYKNFFSNKDELDTVLKQLDTHKMLSKQPNLLSESLSTLDFSGLGERFISMNRNEIIHKRSFIFDLMEWVFSNKLFLLVVFCFLIFILGCLFLFLWGGKKKLLNKLINRPRFYYYNNNWCDNYEWYQTLEGAFTLCYVQLRQDNLIKDYVIANAYGFTEERSRQLQKNMKGLYEKTLEYARTGKIMFRHKYS
jgi:hypothetical protein